VESLTGGRTSRLVTAERSNRRPGTSTVYLEAVSVPAVSTEYIDPAIALYGWSLTLTVKRRRQCRPGIGSDVVHLGRHDIASVAGVRVASGNEQVVAVGNHHVVTATLHTDRTACG